MARKRYPLGLIVVAEKHGTLYYHAETLKALGKSCLSILRRRFGKGGELEYELADDAEELPTPPPIPEDQLTALPDSDVKRAGLEEWNGYRRRVDYYRAHLTLVQWIKQALKEKDWQLAFRVLNERSSYEYEGFQVEPFSE